MEYYKLYEYFPLYSPYVFFLLGAIQLFLS